MSYNAGEQALSFDGGSYKLASWSSYRAAGEITIECWAKLRSHRSTNTGIVTNFLGGGGKANWMWNNAKGFHINGMKGSGNRCVRNVGVFVL